MSVPSQTPESESETQIQCKLRGVVKWIKVARTTYVIINPEFHETGFEVAEDLRKEGYDVVVLNTGVEEEGKEAERLFKEYCGF